MPETFVNRICPHCKKEHTITIKYVNQANKKGVPLYCSKACSGLARRLNKTIEQKKAEKSEYDKVYCDKNKERLKIKAKEWFDKDYAANPEKYKAERKRKYQKHLEYLRTPEYKEYKKQYDETYQAKNRYGEFWEAALIHKQIEKELDSQQIKIDIKISNKSIKRKRQWKKTLSNHSLPQLT